MTVTDHEARAAYTVLLRDAQADEAALELELKLDHAIENLIAAGCIYRPPCGAKLRATPRGIATRAYYSPIPSRDTIEDVASDLVARQLRPAGETRPSAIAQRFAEPGPGFRCTMRPGMTVSRDDLADDRVTGVEPVPGRPDLLRVHYQKPGMIDASREGRRVALMLVILAALGIVAWVGIALLVRALT